MYILSVFWYCGNCGVGPTDIVSVLASFKVVCNLITVRKELDTRILELRQASKLYERYGEIISSAAEEIRKTTDARLPDLATLIETLKESRCEVEDSITLLKRITTDFHPQPPNRCRTDRVSSSTQPATMLRSMLNSWWRTLDTASAGQTWKWNKWQQRILHDVIEDPSPPVLVVKWFSIAMLGLAIHHSHLEDRYQNHFLIAALAVAGLAAHLSSQSLMGGIQTYLPFCVILALCWSAVVHRLGRGLSRCRSRQEDSMGQSWERLRGEEELLPSETKLGLVE